MKLKSRRAVNAQAESARKVAPVAASAIVTTWPPPGNASDCDSTGPSV